MQEQSEPHRPLSPPGAGEPRPASAPRCPGPVSTSAPGQGQQSGRRQEGGSPGSSAEPSGREHGRAGAAEG